VSTFSPNYSNSEAQLLMQLSALAYIDETPLQSETIQQQEARMKKDINAALSSGPPIVAEWQVAWGPALTSDRANMLYFAGNSSLNQYALVIRGTDWSFILNWIEDFAGLLALVPYPALNAGNIAAGTLLGLAALQTLDFEAFLATLPVDAGIYVTGHSLGGCLASVVAPLVYTQCPGTNRVKVYTFASPSPGDQGFLGYYSKLFGNTMAFRVFDTLDCVPNGWATLATIETYYQGFYPCPQDIKNIVNYGISEVGTEYKNVGVDQPLPGQIIWPFGAERLEIDPIGDALFLWEAAQQHASLNYLALLKTQPMTADLALVRAISSRLRLSRGAAK